jgi:hypothetical protein
MANLTIEVDVSGSCTFCFTPTQLVYHFLDRLLVWKFYDDTWISWEAGDSIEDASFPFSSSTLNLFF